MLKTKTSQFWNEWKQKWIVFLFLIIQALSDNYWKWKYMRSRKSNNSSIFHSEQYYVSVPSRKKLHIYLAPFSVPRLDFNYCYYHCGSSCSDQEVNERKNGLHLIRKSLMFQVGLVSSVFLFTPPIRKWSGAEESWAEWLHLLCAIWIRRCSFMIHDMTNAKLATWAS